MPRIDWEIWVCPICGPIDEMMLAEGVDWSQPVNHVTGDIAWTDRYYCQGDHPSTEAVLVNVYAVAKAAFHARVDE